MHPARRSLAQVFAYFAVLGLLFNLSNPALGAASTAFAFLLKDALGLSPTQIAAASFAVSVPLYASLIFGLVRDRWSPLGMGDRGYFVIFGFLTACAYLWLAAVPHTLQSVLGAFFAATCAFQFLAAAQGGITAFVGQSRRLTGGLSALANALALGFTGASFYVGGLAEGHARSRLLFAGLGVAPLLLVPFGLWKPGAVHGDGPPSQLRRPPVLDELKRLLRHRPLHVSLLIWVLFQFSPYGTPFVFFMTRDLGGTPDDYGLFMGLGCVSAVPVCLGYARLCARRPLRTLLWWATALGIPNFLPLLFVHHPWQAIVLAPITGMFGALAQTAYVDLLLRSYPRGLEGTGSEQEAVAGNAEQGTHSGGESVAASGRIPPSAQLAVFNGTSDKLARAARGDAM